MLQLSLDQLAALTLLRSDRWLDIFISSHGRRIDIENIAEHSLLDYQHYLHRKDDHKRAINKYLHPKKSSYSFEFLQGLLEHYLIWQGNCYEVQPNKLAEWKKFCSMVDPMILLAWGYAARLHNKQITIKQIINGNQCPIASEVYCKDKNFADNHSHLGGHGSYRPAMLDFCLKKSNSKLNEKKWPELPEFSHLRSGKLLTKQLPPLMHSLFYYLSNERIINKDGFPNFSNPDTQINKPDLASWLQFSSNKCAFRQLKVVNQTNADKAWLILLTTLFEKERYDSDLPKEWYSAFRAFIHCSQILRASMIHAGVGLGYFVDFSRHKLRQGSNYVAHSLAADSAENVYREVKTTPSTATHQNLFNTAKIWQEKGILEQRHFCLHFIRKTDKSKKHPLHNMPLRKELHAQANQLEHLFSSVALQQAKASNCSTTQSFNLANLVRGLDVAGEENTVAIEVFSPSIRRLRESHWNNLTPCYHPPRRLHLSIHAGEDFNHLISGLRKIDETVQFCSMSEGDRIGHGLALGMDSNVWAKHQGSVFVSAIEHLDNLVWLHHQCANLIMVVPKFGNCLETLKQRICRWSNYIYQQDYDANSLYQAWILRRNCLITKFDKKHSSMPYYRALLPDFYNYSKGDCHKFGKSTDIWKRYQSAELDSKLMERFNQTVTVHHYEQAPFGFNIKECEDYFSSDDLELITAVQDQLITSYNQLGITLEACPSSNIYIGRLDNFREHPLFRWNPPNERLLQKGGQFNKYGLRQGAAKVCINTDDAGLFPTTISNEHRLMKQVAIHHFDVCSKTAESWIDDIRQLGMDQFKRNHLPILND